VISDEEFLFPDEDLDHSHSSSRNELSTGVFRRGNLPRRRRRHSSTEICTVPDEDFVANSAADVRRLKYGPRNTLGRVHNMAEKIAKTGIKRDNDLMYYIKGGDVWATPRKKPGQPKGKAAKVAAAGVDMDYSKYLYYLDSDGDVARQARQVGGSKRKKSAKAAPKKAAAKKPAAKKAAKKPAAKKPAAKKAGGKKGKKR